MKKPNNWLNLISGDLMKRAIASSEFDLLLRKAQQDYLSWDTFKYQSIPNGFTAEEGWAYLKFRRSGAYQQTPIRSVDGKVFNFAMVSSLQEKLNFIDTHASSFIRTTGLSDAQKNKFILTALTEEAIATSQIEGANTSRKVAKAMIASKRKPRTKDEQMIINSYGMMQKLIEWKGLDLSENMLLEIQSIVTENTLDEPDDRGRFRTDADGIVVKDPMTGETVHTPPGEEAMRAELKKLIAFANQRGARSDEEFIHPVVRAMILHFWVAYLHPFVDGNGRTARAVFHWFLLKQGYWLVQYLAVSRAIVHSRRRYDRAFIDSEDESDITYFLFYIAKSFQTAIVKFLEYFEEKMTEDEMIRKVVDKLENYNSRQVALLRYFFEKRRSAIPTEVAIHQAKHGVSRPTAYNDLVGLVHKGLLVPTLRKRKHLFMPNADAIRNLFAH